MNRQEFEDTARRYREEMFRMYASQSMDPPPKPQPNQPPAPPPKPDRPPVPPVPVPPPPKPPVIPPPQPPKLPAPPVPPPKPPVPPLIPPLLPHDRQPLPEYTPSAVPALSDGDSDTAPDGEDTGIILVHVATARGTRPIVGATVTITRNVGGDVQLMSLQITDLSGNIEPVTVPAPPPSADQRDPAAFYYDISVQAAGYYREHSTDVPVFPHITSMQTFEMIPLPAGMDDPLPGGDLTYYNQMQKY